MPAFAHQLPCDGVKLLNDGTRKAGVFEPPVKQHIQEIVAAVIIVEQRRVKAAGGDKGRFTPRTGDFWRRDDIVQGVLEGGRAFDIGINQPEQPIRIGEVRCPQAAGIVVAKQLTGDHIAPGDGRSGPLPVDQIFGMVNLNAVPPLKGGCGNVVILAHAQGAGIGRKARKDRILYGIHKSALVF